MGIKLYKEYLNKNVQERSSLVDMLKSDFDVFRKNGMEKEMVDKAAVALKL